MLQRWGQRMRVVGRWGWVVLLAISIGACAPEDNFSDADPDFADDEETWDEDLAIDEVDLDELDDFAREHLAEVQEISLEEGVEYCGLYGYDADGELVATPAVRGEPDSCDPWNEPDEFVVIASYHTHGSYSPDADSEVPSLDDLEGDIEEQIYGYISTPGGRLWFNDWETESATVIDPGPIEPDPDFQDCPAFPAGTDYTVPELEAREDEDPGTC